MIPNSIIPEEPMRGAVNKTSDVNRLAFQFQTIMAETLFVDAGEIIGAGRASFDMARKALATPAPEPQPEVAAEPVAWRVALDKALYLAVAVQAFCARDAGTDRMQSTIDGLVKVASEADPIIRAALTTPPVVEEAVKADAWQDIATAKPLDLVWCFEPHDEGGFMFSGYLQSDGRWRNNLDAQTQTPTHWKPLPALPARSATP